MCSVLVCVVEIMARVRVKDGVRVCSVCVCVSCYDLSFIRTESRTSLWFYLRFYRRPFCACPLDHEHLAPGGGHPSCGLQHHEKAFKEEGYTLDNLLSSMKQGEEVAKSDLRELKLTLGECRQLITQLRASK